MYFRRNSFFSSAVLLASVVAACSPSTAGPDAPLPNQDGGIPEASTTARDAQQVTDAIADASAAFDADAPKGTLSAVNAGALATTMRAGAFAFVRGTAQYRPKPSTGGTLSLQLEEALGGAEPSRSIEVTLYDDTGTLDTGESFAGEAESSFQPPRHARIEVFQSDGKRWATQGDGTVVVTAIDSANVTLTFQNVGEFRSDGDAGIDVFLLSGTISVARVAFPARTGSSNVMVTNVQAEPNTSEPANIVSASQGFSSATTLTDTAFPYIGDRRMVSATDTVGATNRTLRIAFPSGHLPRVGVPYPLNLFSRVNIIYFEGTYTGDVGDKVWEADLGTLTVISRSATQLEIQLNGARMQSESPTAKGLFTLAGTLSVALP